MRFVLWISLLLLASPVLHAAKNSTVPVALFFGPHSGRLLLIEADPEEWKAVLAARMKSYEESELVLKSGRAYLGHAATGSWPLARTAVTLGYSGHHGLYFKMNYRDEHAHLSFGRLDEAQPGKVLDPSDVSYSFGETFVKVRFNPDRIFNRLRVWRSTAPVVGSNAIFGCHDYLGY